MILFAKETLKEKHAVLHHDTAMDDTDDLKTLQKLAQELGRLLQRLGKVKPDTAGAVDAVAALLPKLPTAAAVDELRDRLQRWVDAALGRRRAAFGALEVELVRGMREKQRPVREVTDGWRIGWFELQVQRESSQARVLYDREVVVPWDAVGTIHDLEAALSRAEKQMLAAELRPDDRNAVFLAAFEHLCAERARRRIGAPDRIPILDFYREVRAQLVRHELKGKAPEHKLRQPGLEKRWAFLFNLDRYVAQRSELPAEQRLSLETGSQAEQQKGLGLVTGGLDGGDYQTFCFVKRAVVS